MAAALACATLACISLGGAPALADDGITHAQAQLRLEPLKIVTKRGVFRFQAEIADTATSQEVGLMYRPKLARDRGMLFEMGGPQEASFWMEHCAHPLDMLFIKADGRILSIARNTTPFSLNPINSGGPVVAVLEIRGGRASEMGAQAGDLVRHAYFHNG
jgi:uncharacterized membrane protein (UPF0127 family)